MASIINGSSSKKMNEYSITPCDVIFKHTTKPENYLYCRSINLYEDRWRINIYSKRIVDGISGKYISKSFFVIFNTSTGAIKILS